MDTADITLETLDTVLRLDPATARLVSWRAKAVPDQEFIAASPEHPTFQIQYFDAGRQYQLLTSHQATSVSTHVETEGSLVIVVAEFRRIGGFCPGVPTPMRAHPPVPLHRRSIA